MAWSRASLFMKRCFSSENIINLSILVRLCCWASICFCCLVSCLCSAVCGCGSPLGTKKGVAIL